MGLHPPPDERSSAYGKNGDQHPGSNVWSVMNMRGHARSPQHDARSQQGGPEPPAVHHHHEGDRRSQCGVVGWEPVVSRVGEQGLDRRVHDKRGGGLCRWRPPRASLAAMTGNIDTGAATLEQQLAKDRYFPKNDGLFSKVAEAELALKLDAHYSTNDILRMYLAEVYFGHG